MDTPCADWINIVAHENQPGRLQPMAADPDRAELPGVRHRRRAERERIRQTPRQTDQLIGIMVM